jgi:hypothetical protein
MIACLYINGRPVSAQVQLFEGVEEFIRQTRSDQGEIVAQLALYDETSIEFGHCPLARRPYLQKFTADETQPGHHGDF